MIVFPVVHIMNYSQAERQANIALSSGADGVFFIHHGILGDALTLRLAKDFKALHPSKTIGVNLLSMDAAEAVKSAFEAGINDIWVDHAGVHSEKGEPALLQFLAGMAKAHNLNIHAGVAFKYQRHEPMPGAAVKMAMEHNLIPVTSGSGTGVAADVDKIATMAKVANGKLGVASGLTVENIEQYRPHVNYAFVATGVSVNDYEFDEEKLCQFIEAAHK